MVTPTYKCNPFGSTTLVVSVADAVGASVGIPTLKVVSGGVDIAFGESLLPIGFGASMGVGVGALPADVAIGGSYAWPIWSTQDIKKDVVKVFKDVTRVAPCKR